MTASQPPQPPQGGGQPPQQGPPPGYGQPQGPPPGYQQGPPPGYQQGPPPGYQQGPPPGYQQGPPPGWQPQGQPNPYAQPAGTGGPGFSFDLKKLKMADYVIAGGTVLYLVFALFPWYQFGDDEFFGFSLSGFESGNVTSAFVLFLLATAWALLPAFVDLKIPFPRSWITVGLAALGFLLTLFAWLDTFDVDFSVWALLGFLTSAAILLFAVLALLPELKNRPALPGGLANAAQWANQPAPDFGQQPGGQYGAPQGQPGPQYGAPQGQPGPQHGAPQGHPAPQYGQPTPPPPPPSAQPTPPPPAQPSGPPAQSPGQHPYNPPPEAPGAPERPAGS